MEDYCPHCERKLVSKKIHTCNFCDKYFCCITCLMQHSYLHSKTGSNSLITNTLRKRQTKGQTKQFSFICQGIFTDNYIYDKKYDIKNFSKIYEGFMPIELGSGSFGHVYLVKHNINQKKYALKVINKRQLLQTFENCKLIYNEIEIHSKLNHPNIIRLYNVLETEEEISILLEYAENGNLYNLIQQEKEFSELKAYKYFIQIVNAVYFLHQNNIIHRDIKPENILIGENDILKLCDFGWAKELTVENRHTFCGTVEYMAPEIVGSEKYDCSVDIWSLGILLYELLMGHSPFSSKKDNNIMIKIKLHDLSFKEKPLSKDCIDLIKGLLEPNPSNRLKIKEILVHPFIINNSKKCQKITNSKRKESINNSNENIMKFLEQKNNNFTIEFDNLRKKFGFDNGISLREQLSSRELIEFKSDKKIISLKTFNISKAKKTQSQRLEKLIDNMSNELEKARKKIDHLNFKSGKQFSFEDFRDNSDLFDNSKIKETNDNSNYENTFENEDSKNNSFHSIPEEDSF